MQFISVSMAESDVFVSAYVQTYFTELFFTRCNNNAVITPFMLAPVAGHNMSLHAGYQNGKLDGAAGKLRSH